MRKDTANWVQLSEYDLGTAHHMLATGRYLYVVFCCHLAMEKMLKAVATEVLQCSPPRTHDLLYLTKLSTLRLPQGLLEFVGTMNNVSVITRYPDDLASTLREYPESVVRSYLGRTEDVVQWLRQQIPLQQ